MRSPTGADVNADHATTDAGRAPRSKFGWVLLGAGAGLVALTLADRGEVSRWLVVVGYVAPDLSFVAAIGAPEGAMPRRAVHAYNAAHRWVVPTVAAVSGLMVGRGWLSVVGVAWAGHLGVDRALGYRLRNPDGSIRAPRRLR